MVLWRTDVRLNGLYFKTSWRIVKDCGEVVIWTERRHEEGPNGSSRLTSSIREHFIWLLDPIRLCPKRNIISWIRKELHCVCFKDLHECHFTNGYTLIESLNYKWSCSFGYCNFVNLSGLYMFSWQVFGSFKLPLCESLAKGESIRI